MEKITIDSSVFISAFLETDRFHEESKKFFHHLQSRELLVIEPIIVLLEVLNVLTKAGVKDCSPILESFRAFHTMPLNDSMVSEAHFVFQKCQLKTSDAIIVWCASASESTLVSWDAQLVREAKKLTVAQRPSDYLRLA